MTQRIFGLALCAMLFALSFLGVLLSALSFPVEAQQPAKPPRIGFIMADASGSDPRVDAFRQGLRELGYVEGKNIGVDYRFAEGKEDRLVKLVAELVNQKMEVIVTDGTAVTRAVKNATTTIPIVMASDGDPVGNLFVASLARPGGLGAIFQTDSRNLVQTQPASDAKNFGERQPSSNEPSLAIFSVITSRLFFQSRETGRITAVFANRQAGSSWLNGKRLDHEHPLRSVPLF